MRAKHVRSLSQYVRNARYVLVPFRSSDGEFHMRTWAWRLLFGYAHPDGGGAS